VSITIASPNGITTITSRGFGPQTTGLIGALALIEAEATGNRKRARAAEREIRQLEKRLSNGDGLKASIEEFTGERLIRLERRISKLEKVSQSNRSHSKRVLRH
jgi:hypothetical protein